MANPLVMTNIAMVKPWPIEIDGLPVNSRVIFHGKPLNNQMVYRNIWMCHGVPKILGKNS